jgi:outer membrane lipoprotein SlyB
MKRFAFAVALLTITAAQAAQAQNYQQQYQPYQQQYQPYQQQYQPYQQNQGYQVRNYQQDLAECQAYANQVSPVQDAAVGALGGAALGAGLGALTGAAVKGVSVGEGAAVGAIGGGVLGLAGGAYSGHQNQQDVLNNCMRGRGYSTYY